MTAECKSFDKCLGICLCSFSAPLPNFLPRELCEAFQPETLAQSHSSANWGASTWFNCSSPSKGLTNISSSLAPYSLKAYLLAIYLYAIILNTGKHHLYEDPHNVMHAVLNCISINEDSCPKILNQCSSLILPKDAAFGFLSAITSKSLTASRKVPFLILEGTVALLKKWCDREPISLSFWKTMPFGE